MQAALDKARQEEPWPLAKSTLDLLWSNLSTAKEENLPICQDTGMACVFVELGTDVHIDGSFEAAIHEGVRRGYTDLQSAILGLIPSVQLHGGQIIIRGIGSVNSNNAALILCDGVEVRSLNSINIRDVVSVEVQKGSNMYGLRGGNGVILIRTRK